MSEYAKMKNAELEALLKQRGLPHSGKKAELVARLQEDDQKPAQDATAPPSKPAKEDEIDWDDDAGGEAAQSAPAQDVTAAATTTTSTITTTSDAKPTEETAAATNSAPQADAPSDQAATGDANAPVPTEPKEEKDFTMGLGEISIDDELEKRKARALKFGMTENDPLAEEAMQKLERARKFGEAAGPRGLNEALPGRMPKRRRDDQDGSGRISKHRGRGRRQFGRRDGGPRRPRDGGGDVRAGNGSWMSGNDRAAAEARKARFA